MMGHRQVEQAALLYEFSLDKLSFPKIPSDLNWHDEVESLHRRGRCLRSFMHSGCLSSIYSSRVVGLKPRTSCYAVIVAQRDYYGFTDRLRIDRLYRSGQLRGAALAHVIDHAWRDSMDVTDRTLRNILPLRIFLSLYLGTFFRTL